ncbi:MAG: FAD-binding protein [Pelagimonas sp.]|uniref:FAD-binding protein n=1 Tax=Pelagimonas sp. TaxID=2073170 RepID=UPI003D6B0D50
MTTYSPQTEAELAECIHAADAPLRIQGGGTRPVGQVVAHDLVEMSQMAGITLYDPGALTLVAQAGTPLQQIQDTLLAERQRLAFEPQDLRGLLGTSGQSTIGGVVASNSSGPRRIQCGACRDFALGVRFVDGAGTVLKNGGRVMKNVTGYDLVKLLSGSWGTLGVLSEVSLKTQPTPETSACILINGLSDAEAVAAMSQALSSPFEITGAAHAPVGVDGLPVTMLRIEGFDGSVSYRTEKLRDMFGTFDVSVERDPERLQAGWRWVRDVEMMHGQSGDVWRISCKPSDGPDLVSRLNAKSVLYDWGGGLIWALMPEGRDLRAVLGAFGGHATLMRSGATDPTIATFQPEPAALATLSTSLRAKFDPKGILNSGIMA